MKKFGDGTLDNLVAEKHLVDLIAKLEKDIRERKINRVKFNKDYDTISRIVDTCTNVIDEHNLAHYRNLLQTLKDEFDKPPQPEHKNTGVVQDASTVRVQPESSSESNSDSSRQAVQPTTSAEGESSDDDNDYDWGKVDSGTLSLFFQTEDAPIGGKVKGQVVVIDDHYKSTPK